MEKVLFQIRYKKSVAKELRNLAKSDLVLVMKKIQALAEVPFPSGAITLQGSANLYRIRQGDYRIIYEVKNQELIIMVVKVGHRREVYRGV